MHGKVVVITGGTSGVGEFAAERLAGMGARIILVARDKGRGEATLARLRAANPNAKHEAYYGELASMKDTKRIAADIAAAEPQIDVLINNAGGRYDVKQTTAEGLDLTFATNHMSYFLLTNGLLDRLRAAPAARIINTASDRAMVATLDFDDLQSAKRYSGYRAYCKSKLCNMYFTRALAKRLKDSGITVNAWNPGFTKTRFHAAQGLHMRLLNNLLGGDPRERAETLVYLASSPEVANTTGAFYAYMKPGKVSAVSQDDAAAEKLWQISDEIARAAA